MEQWASSTYLAFCSLRIDQTTGPVILLRHKGLCATFQNRAVPFQFSNGERLVRPVHRMIVFLPYRHHVEAAGIRCRDTRGYYKKGCKKQWSDRVRHRGSGEVYCPANISHKSTRPWTIARTHGGSGPAVRPHGRLERVPHHARRFRPGAPARLPTDETKSTPGPADDPRVPGPRRLA